MAGARLGFVFGNEALIRDIDKIRHSFNSYNVNRLTMAAGIAALEDRALLHGTCAGKSLNRGKRRNRTSKPSVL